MIRLFQVAKVQLIIIRHFSLCLIGFANLSHFSKVISNYISDLSFTFSVNVKKSVDYGERIENATLIYVLAFVSRMFLCAKPMVNDIKTIG